MLQKDENYNSSVCVTLDKLLCYVIQPEQLSEEQCEEISWHIAKCKHCANRFEVLADANAEFYQFGSKATAFKNNKSVAIQSLADFWQRVDKKDEPLQRKQYRQEMFCIRRIAVAACVLIVFGICCIALRNDNSDRSLLDVGITKPESAVAFSVLVTDQGFSPLAMDQPILSGSQPVKILLGGIHHVMMNRQTKATFSVVPQRTEGFYKGKVLYEIQLVRGELYVEVVPGNPFTVKTANARLDITGTKFDVVADDNKTELILLKGSVRFCPLDYPQKNISVTAGYASTISGQFAPSVPHRVDSYAMTAWACDANIYNAEVLTDKQVGAKLVSTYFNDEFCLRVKIPDVDTLVYEQWRDEHLQSCLARTALAVLPKDKAENADWIELLMISGDIWQFQYDPTLPADQPLSRIDPVAITRQARYYGLDEKDIWEALDLTDLILTPLSVENGMRGRQSVLALRRWYDAVMSATATGNNIKGNPRLFSLYASLYLAETKTAAYLWVKSHLEQANQLLGDSEYLAFLPTPPPKACERNVNEWLIQLHDEANSARNCVPVALEWLLIQPSADCVCQPTEQQRYLAKLIAKLTPASQLEGN